LSRQVNERDIESSLFGVFNYHHYELEVS